MNDDLRELYQQVILDHSRRPRNYGELGPDAVHVHGDNPSCGDELDLWVRFDPAGGVEDIRFSGQGCAISQAAASMMTSRVKGMSAGQVDRMAAAYRGLVTADAERDAPVGLDDEELGELALMQGVRKFPQRVKCAMLAWRALEQAIAEHQAERDGD